MYDLIGDIHGHAAALEALLGKLGYQLTRDGWRHSERVAVFVGDFIDRGPEQLRTLRIVRDMVGLGAAKASMGNHELNAWAWHTPDPAVPGEHLRRHVGRVHGLRNRHQHASFLAEVEQNPTLHSELVAWFSTLPLWLELGEIQVVHACWHPRLLAFLRPLLTQSLCLPAELLASATRGWGPLSEQDSPDPNVFKAIEALLKGLEAPLPEGHSFLDSDGHERKRVRLRWWDSEARTFRAAALLAEPQRAQLPDSPLPSHLLVDYDDPRPVFFGHYWMTGEPRLLGEKVACLDYSIARGGKLAGYRWGGEACLSAAKFVSVG